MPTILEPITQLSQDPMTDRERQWVNQLRVLLKDVPMEDLRTLNTLVEDKTGQRWTDTQLLVYLNQAMAEINSEPPMTNFDVNGVPDMWRGCIINGGMIYALISEGILQVGLSWKGFCNLFKTLCYKNRLNPVLYI